MAFSSFVHGTSSVRCTYTPKHEPPAPLFFLRLRLIQSVCLSVLPLLLLLLLRLVRPAFCISRSCPLFASSCCSSFCSCCSQLYRHLAAEERSVSQLQGSDLLSFFLLDPKRALWRGRKLRARGKRRRQGRQPFSRACSRDGEKFRSWSPRGRGPRRSSRQSVPP